jgi:L-ectoine synthase
MGFSLNDTIIKDGSTLTLEYKNHLEACYCIEGEGVITALDDDISYPIKPFTLYALNKHDSHTISAVNGDMRLICIFNPPLTGQEIHGDDGSYSQADNNEKK